MSRRIPDLRPHDNEFTFEHCSVLCERLGATLSPIYTDEMQEIVAQVDSAEMHADLTSIMSSTQLAILFQTDVGKGLILGIFFTHFILNVEQEEGY